MSSNKLCREKCECLIYYDAEGTNHYYVCKECDYMYCVSTPVMETSDKLRKKNASSPPPS